MQIPVKDREIDKTFRVLRIGCWVCCALVAVVAVAFSGAVHAIGGRTQNVLRIERLRADLALQTELMSSSLNMAAATGAADWQVRYQDALRKRKDAIVELDQVLYDNGDADVKTTSLVSAEEVRQAEETLNQRVLDLLRDGDRIAAMELLLSEQSQDVYEMSSQSIAMIMQQADRRMEGDFSLQRRYYLQTVVISLTVIGLMAAVLWYAVNLIRSLILSRIHSEQRLKRHANELAELKLLAESASKAKTQFLANMSHEIRTPLTIVMGYAELLEDSVTTDEQWQSLQVIRQHGRGLLAVINSVLDLSRIESGQLELEQASISPIQQIRELLDELQIQASQKGLTLGWSCLSQVPAQIKTDPTRLRQILMNLINNAIKFTQEGGVRVSVSFSRDPRPLITFAVSDSGIGMSPEQSSRIFEAYRQSEAMTHRKYGGTGLGLSICHQLSDLLGGELTVQSQLGQGSTFTLSVPVSESEASKLVDADQVAAGERSATHPKDHVSLQGCRILVADDEPLNRAMIQRMLDGLGAEVLCVEDGQAVVEATKTSIRNNQPLDAILIDMRMPRMDGEEATRHIRHLGYEGPVIALTADAIGESREKLLLAGCDHFITKPFERVRLTKLLVEVTHSFDALRSLSLSRVDRNYRARDYLSRT